MKNGEAAELLGVNVRTLKRWMGRPDIRKALSAVQHRKQHRIPRPDNLPLWERRTRERLKLLGVHLKDPVARELDEIGQKWNVFLLETYRLYLAAWTKAVRLALATGASIGQETKDRILDLWQLAENNLAAQVYRAGRKAQPSEAQIRKRIDDLEFELPAALITYWPDKQDWPSDRAARTLKGLEEIREGIDYTQAIYKAKQGERKEMEHTTGEFLRLMLHRDIMEQINDTGVKMPQGGVNDMRAPQTGVKLRTFRTRYPRKGKKGLRQAQILAAVYGIQEAPPSAEERQEGRRTSVG